MGCRPYTKGSARASSVLCSMWSGGSGGWLSRRIKASAKDGNDYGDNGVYTCWRDSHRCLQNETPQRARSHRKAPSAAEDQFLLEVLDVDLGPVVSSRQMPGTGSGCCAALGSALRSTLPGS
jgi:hypothetical protein